MKKILGLFVIVLGLTGCSMNVAPTLFEEPSQNSVEWIITEDESRDAVFRGIDQVWIEKYRVPIRDGKYIRDEAEYLESRALERGDGFPVKSAKDYNYEFATYVRCIEFNYSFIFGGSKDEINFFDYEGDTVMEVVRYYGGPLEHIEEEDGWIMKDGVVYYRGEQEGCTAQYVFFNRGCTSCPNYKFYKEHKYGGRIVWDNN